MSNSVHMPLQQPHVGMRHTNPQTPQLFTSEDKSVHTSRQHAGLLPGKNGTLSAHICGFSVHPSDDVARWSNDGVLFVSPDPGAAAMLRMRRARIEPEANMLLSLSLSMVVVVVAAGDSLWRDFMRLN